MPPETREPDSVDSPGASGLDPLASVATFERARHEAPRRTAEHWVLLVGSLGAVLGLVALGLFLTPDARGFGTHEQLGLLPCFPMEAWTVPCPGCGVTTALTQATHGDLVGAFVTQPLGLALALLAPVFALWALRCHAAGRDVWIELHTWNWSRWGSVVLGFVVLAWIYKFAAVRWLV